MRVLFFALFAIAYGLPAMAHVGHLGELAGHDHWVAGAALGVAAAITLWAGLKGRKSKSDESSNDTDDEAETKDAEAEA
jgi:membrane protein implicated in regulation of membrane protease activity